MADWTLRIAGHVALWPALAMLLAWGRDDGHRTFVRAALRKDFGEAWIFLTGG